MKHSEKNIQKNSQKEYKKKTLAIHTFGIYTNNVIILGGFLMKKKIERFITLLTGSILCLVLCGCAPAGEAGTSGGSNFSGIILLVVMIAVFYVFLIRPENKKKKKAEEMRNNLSVGDKITTIGGMVGKVVDVSGELITFETGEDRVRIQVTKWAISSNESDKDSNSK